MTATSAALFARHINGAQLDPVPRDLEGASCRPLLPVAGPRGNAMNSRAALPQNPLQRFPYELQSNKSQPHLEAISRCSRFVNAGPTSEDLPDVLRTGKDLRNIPVTGIVRQKRDALTGTDGAVFELGIKSTGAE